MTFVPSIYRTMQRRRQPKRQVRTEQYRTYKHYQRGTEAARKYRGWVERKTTRDGRRGGGFEKFGRGAAMAPAGLIEYGSVIPIALESAVRKPKQTAEQAVPGLVSGFKGMASEAKKRPYEVGGEVITQAALMYGLQRGISKVPGKVPVKTPKHIPKTPKGIPKGKTQIIQKGKPIYKVVPKRAGSKIVTHRKGQQVFKQPKRPGVIDRPLTPEVQKSVLGRIPKETKVAIPKTKPKTPVKQPGVIDRPLSPEMQKSMSKHFPKKPKVALDKPTTKVIPKKTDIPFDKPLSPEMRKSMLKGLPKKPKIKPKATKTKPDVIDRPLTTEMRRRMLKDIPKQPKIKTPKVDKPPKIPDEIVLKPLEADVQKSVLGKMPKETKVSVPKTTPKTKPIADKPLSIDVRQEILKQYGKSGKVGAERITHVSQRQKAGVATKRAPSKTSGEPPKYEYPTIHPEELPGKIGKKAPQKIDIYERAVGKPKPTVSPGKIKQLEILVKELKEEIKVTPGKGRTQLKANLRNLERELKLGSGEYVEQAVKGQTQQQITLVKTKPPVFRVKKITPKQITKPTPKVGKIPKTRMKIQPPIPIVAPTQFYKQETKQGLIQKKESKRIHDQARKHMLGHKQARMQGEKQARKQNQKFLQDLKRAQAQDRKQKRKQAQKMKKAQTRATIPKQLYKTQVPPKTKAKPKKKSKDEKLREFEEKAKEYDPGAWFERHKIATIEEMLGK